MKKIDPQTQDWLRPEYKRPDLGELVRGRYAGTQVEFAELVGLLIVCIGQDEQIHFLHHSIGNNLAGHKRGDWTYEIDNSNQITLRFWISEFKSVAQSIPNPTSIMSLAERTELQNLITEHVGLLKCKVAELKS